LVQRQNSTRRELDRRATDGSASGIKAAEEQDTREVVAMASSKLEKVDKHEQKTVPFNSLHFDQKNPGSDFTKDEGRHGVPAYMPCPERHRVRQPRSMPGDCAPASRLPRSPARGTSFEREMFVLWNVCRQTRVDLGASQDQMALLSGVDRSCFG
jgi:hypothetical protein